MKKVKNIKRTFLFLCVMFVAGCTAKGAQAPDGKTEAGGIAKYIFVFIGDGTSIPQRNAAEFYLADKNSPENLDNAVKRAEGKFPAGTGVTDFTPAIDRMLMSTFPGQGFSSTYSSNSLITDSSSSGTAISTGHKTRDGVVGMDPECKTSYVSMAKMAKSKGMMVGIVSTVSLDHATPASFYATCPNRDFYYDIALQVPQSGFDYFAGGGFKQPQGAKGDKKSIYDIFDEAGYKVYNTREDFDALKPGATKVITINPVLDSDQAIPYAIDQKEGEISFAEFVAKGIELMDNPAGFFMMAESGKVDWACHANDAVATVTDVLALDEGVKAAYEFYQKHPAETLILVTGDHETGGMTLGFAGTKYDAFLSKLRGQKGSYLAFDKELKAFKEKNPAGTFDDFFPIITDFFGLTRYSPAEYAKLSAQAKEGSTKAYEKLGMALKDYELEDLKKAFAFSMMDAKARPASTDEYYLAYGGYEPVTVTLTHILNQKSGIGWTTYSHTGLPTPVSVIGVGYELFNGYYDNTDIFTKVVEVGKL